MGKSSNKILIIVAFFAIYVIWGSTYLLNKIAVLELPAFMLASFRFTIAGILILVLAKLMGIKIRVAKKQLLNSIIAGFLFLSFGNGIVVWALRYVDTGFAALEISAQPLIVLLLMRILHGKKIQPMSVIGVVFGIIGIYLLVSQKEIIAKENSVTGMVMIFLCMLSWGYGSLFVAKADMPSNYFVNTGYQMFTGG
ncbi:putative transporter [Flagellimonas maritima]|uniref:Putative transporter n=1 Tax=Flagellimonas maritima TaxID=1383885 RepID=A0A2Z4LWH3_9FLAO|nr:putative transporter [Allomuricauda aurantiaca]